MFTLMVILVCFDTRAYSINAINVFEDLLVFKEGSGFLLISGTESKIAIADASGKITAFYDKKGQGPNELNVPIYLGRFQGKFLVLTHWNRLIGFDDHLVPTAIGKLDDIGDGTFYLGINNKQGWYWVYRGFSRSPNLVVAVRPKATGDGFDFVKSFYPQPKERNLAGMPFANQSHLKFHNNTTFKLSNMEFKDDYEVEVLGLITEERPELILTGELSGYAPLFKGRPAIAGTEMAFSFPDGYLVRFSAKKRPDERSTKFMDVFDKKGRFKKRLEVERELFPCINCPYAFEYQDTDDRYHRIDTVADWLANQ